MIEMDCHVLYRTQFLDHFSNLELCLSRRSLYQTTVTVQTQMCKTNRTECLRTVGRSTQSAVLTTVHILLIFCITAPRNVLPFQLTVQSRNYLRTNNVGSTCFCIQSVPGERCQTSGEYSLC